MKGVSPLLALALAPIALLSSCGGPPGMTLLDQPLTQGPVLRALFDPDELTPATKAYLEERSLLAAYRKDPAATIVLLRKGLPEESFSPRHVALIELCSDEGNRLEKKDPRKAAGYYLAAAELAYPAATSSGASGRGREYRAAYNHSSGQVARILFESNNAWGRTAEMPGPWKTYRVKSRTRGTALIDPGQYDDLKAAEYLELKGVELDRIRQEGLGAAMVAFQEGTPERRAANPLMPEIGMSLPVNATLEFSQRKSEVVLSFHDLLLSGEARIAGRIQPLSADLTAPFGILLNHKIEHNAGWKGLVHPEEYLGRMGLFQLEPYRPDQIPVIFVHGLMSTPETWLSSLNQLRADPQLRKRFQLYFFRYPTGFPIIYNAGALRSRIAAFQKQVDPGGRNPKMKDMVLIGHSMGGILSNTQIRDSDDTLTSRLFAGPISEVKGLDAKQKAGLKELLVYDANPDISRAIFVAAPHRGSDLATNPIARFASKLVKFPSLLASQQSLAGVEGMTPLGKKVIMERPDSIWGLKPNAPGTSAILEQKIRKGVTVHSIIARKKPGDAIEESNDGVVPYWSSHLDVVASEKIVHATHTTINANGDAMKEVARILYVHAGLPPKS